MAQSRGMVLRLPPVQPRSRLAHEAAAFASDEGRFDEMNNALFRAFFEHGEDIGRPDILTQLATSAGIDGGKLATALKTKRYPQCILADETKAHELGLSGVPGSSGQSSGRTARTRPSRGGGAACRSIPASGDSCFARREQR